MTTPQVIDLITYTLSGVWMISNFVWFIMLRRWRRELQRWSCRLEEALTFPLESDSPIGELGEPDSRVTL